MDTNVFDRLDFQLILHKNGEIVMQYRNISPEDQRQLGSGATVGIKNHHGIVGLQYSYNERAIFDGLAIRYFRVPLATVEGVVTGASDGLPVAGATVRQLQGGALMREVRTNSQGVYRARVPLGSYRVEAIAPHDASVSAQVVVEQAEQLVHQALVVSPTIGSGSAGEP